MSETERTERNSRNSGDTAEIWEGCFITPEEKAYWVALASTWKMSLYETVCEAFNLLYDQMLAEGYPHTEYEKHFYTDNQGMLRLIDKTPFPLEPYSLIENTVRRKKEQYTEKMRKEAIESWYYFDEANKGRRINNEWKR